MKTLRIILVIVLCGFAHLSIKADQSAKDRPNIIFLLTDDQRDNTLSGMGHPWVKTPHLDQLMNDGVRFTNTYTASPVCSPSRISFFTGVPERIHGVGFSSDYALTEAQWTQSYPAILRKSGYHTGFVGKIGMEYYTFRGNAAEKFDFWRGHDGWALFFPKNSEKQDNLKIYDDSENETIIEITGESISRFFDQVPDDKPFCLSVSFSTPHGSQAVSMGAERDFHIPSNENPKLTGHPIYGDLYRDLEIAIPEDTATDPYRYIPEAMMNQKAGRTSTYYYNYDVKSVSEHHIRYYQMITGIDQVVGALFERLEKEGLADNTIIIFSSDHGLLMGEYGMGGKSLLYDLSAKIPCIVYDPRLPDESRGTSRDELVTSLDVTSTILDYAGQEQPADMEGKSLVPLIEETSPEWRDQLFLESLFTLRDNPFCEGIREGKWKYIRMYDGVTLYSEDDLDFSNRKPEFEQLFDLEADPEEKVNLIADYEGKPLLERLRKACADHSITANARRADYVETNKIVISNYKKSRQIKRKLKSLDMEHRRLTREYDRLEAIMEKKGEY